MAKPTILKDRHTGEGMYPHTLASLVQTAAGTNVDEALTAKQDALTTSEDLEISEDSELSLTEKGKRAVFDDMYLTAAGMYGEIDYTHTEDGVQKPYKLNGLWLTYEEAQECYVQTTGSGTEEWAFTRVTARTNMPPRYVVDPATWTMKIKAIAMATNIEVLNLMPNDKNIRLLPIGDMRYAFYDSWIRVINGVLDCQYATADSMKTGLYACKRLESVQLKNIKHDTSLRSSSKLSLESVEYMVANAANTTAITVTVHPDVYAKLTGDTTNAAAAALTPEELAQWQQVLADAVAKNISFATV